MRIFERDTGQLFNLIEPVQKRIAVDMKAFRSFRRAAQAVDIDLQGRQKVRGMGFVICLYVCDDRRQVIAPGHLLRAGKQDRGQIIIFVVGNPISWI